MKTKFPLALILMAFSAMTLFAQNNDSERMQTLFDGKPIVYGGYGGPRVAYSQFDGHDTWLVGGRGGAIFNHTFVVGGAGFGIVNSPNIPNIDDNDVVYLEGGYGGMLFEYILKPNKLLHLSFPLVIGAGGLIYSETSAANGGPNFEERIIANTAFFVVEPGVEIELNIVRFMRIAGGISYRYAHNIDLPDTPSNAFNSLLGSVSLKFGSF